MTVLVYMPIEQGLRSSSTETPAHTVHDIISPLTLPLLLWTSPSPAPDKPLAATKPFPLMPVPSFEGPLATSELWEERM